MKDMNSHEFIEFQIEKDNQGSSSPLEPLSTLSTKKKG